MQDTTNRQPAITRNRTALLRIVAALFFMAGLDEGGADELPRRVWRKILRLLRPAESAARRLIVVAARGLAVEPPRPRKERAPTGIERLQAAGLLTIREVNLGLARAWRPEPPAAPEKAAPRVPAFALTDPPRRFDTRAWDGLRLFPKDGFEFADPDEAVNAARICRRLAALKRALDDIDGHAKRLARREARLAITLPSSSGLIPRQAERRRCLRGPTASGKTLRLGHPPGYRRRPAHEVDDILRECHSLALYAPRPDTS